ncbi:hypothetical protein K456DRAFT_219524 [Colletotrichum gloeosporioides 23]|nr:hypothetical protein K456DRAFT_219524 [Colletotrichum gloeosporioides 23]
MSSEMRCLSLSPLRLGPRNRPENRGPVDWGILPRRKFRFLSHRPPPTAQDELSTKFLHSSTWQKWVFQRVLASLPPHFGDPFRRQWAIAVTSWYLAKLQLAKYLLAHVSADGASERRSGSGSSFPIFRLIFAIVLSMEKSFHSTSPGFVGGHPFFAIAVPNVESAISLLD